MVLSTPILLNLAASRQILFSVPDALFVAIIGLALVQQISEGLTLRKRQRLIGQIRRLSTYLRPFCTMVRTGRRLQSMLVPDLR